jgi:hypothetical protein
MSLFAKALIIAGISLAAGGNAWAVIPEKYQTILDRNAFGLVPAPEVKPQEAPPPPVNIKLTGFATIGGERRVYFTIPPKDPKDVQQYINLAEGQRDGTLEVISIAESEGEVRIRNGGTDMVLSLKKDGFQPAKLAPGMTPAPMPPMPLGPAPNSQPSAVVSPVYNPITPGSVVANAPAQLQPAPLPEPQPGQPQVQPSTAQPGTVQHTASGEIRTIPTRTLRVPPVPQNTTP